MSIIKFNYHPPYDQESVKFNYEIKKKRFNKKCTTYVFIEIIQLVDLRKKEFGNWVLNNTHERKWSARSLFDRPRLAVLGNSGRRSPLSKAGLCPYVVAGENWTRLAETCRHIRKGILSISKTPTQLILHLPVLGYTSRSWSFPSPTLPDVECFS